MSEPTLVIQANPSPSETVGSEVVFELMEMVSATPGGIKQLVERYAGSTELIVVRALSFLLARVASRQTYAGSLLPLVWETLRHLRSGDDWTRINILSAIHLGSLYEEIPASDEAGTLLGPLLADALDGPAPVQAAALSTLARLRADGVTAMLAPEHLARIDQKVKLLASSPDELVRMEVQSLEET